MPEKITQQYIEDEMRQSYLDYGMSVIIGRALPDVRDGLKPVHRRILYAMHQMGLTHDKPFKKCARVVGECFVKDTLVATTRGLIPIQEVKKGDIVLTENGKEKVVELYEMPKKELLKVTLENGISNVVTKSQKFKVLTKDLNAVWKEAKDLKKGDYVVVRAVYPKIKEYVKLGMLNGREIFLNENIGYLLGQLLSDGWVEKGYNRGKGFRCGFCSTSQSVIKKIAKILEKEFEYKPKIEKRVRSKRTLYMIRINKAQINDFLVNVFKLQQATAHTKKIPRQIFSSPKSVIVALISGLIDGDGHVHKRRNVLSFDSVSEKMINQLQILLLHLGIISKKYSGKKLTSHILNGRLVARKHLLHSLEIKSRFAVLLSTLLNLSDELKAERLKLLKTRNVSHYDIIPYAGKVIFQELSEKHIGGGWYKDTQGTKFRRSIKYPTGSKIRYSSDLKEKSLGKTQIKEWGIQEKLNKIGSDLANFINHVIEDSIFFLKVKNVEESKPEKTYDIQVENAHEFIANGMVVHNCLGKFHPHGDTAVYDALVRMAQPFALRYPLIQGQGNFGSIDGDAPAAMRYTECRLTSFASECLKDINKNTVRFVPNFDASLKEPTCLPALPPLLLLNGSTGIAVGMATNIPPHNLAETVDAITAYIENPSITIDELMQHIKGPDFPTGALIIGSKGIVSAYKTGKGKIKIRAKCEIEDNKIIITEIPFMLNKSSLIEEIASLVREGKIDGITDIRDESSRGKLRVLLMLKKSINPEIVLKQLYLHTRLQTTFGIISLALVDGVPTLLNLKDIIAHYVSHRKTVITKRLEFELTQASKREHIVKGLLTALSNIEKTIEIIKKSRSPAEASTALMQAFAITKEQAKAILEMPLQKLTTLESTALEEEHKRLTEQIKKLRFILSSEKEILNIIKEELQQLKKKYADERRTTILPEEEEITIEEIIVPELSIVTVTRKGFIKRTSLALFRRQRRGGKGLSTLYSAEDVVEHLFLAKTTAQLLVFTNKGKVHWIPVYKLPDATRYAKGKHISTFIQLGKDEKIATIIPIEEFKNNLIMITRKGIVKKLPLALLKKPRRGGILAIFLSDDDSLISVIHAKEEDELLIATKRGMALRFKAAEVRAMGRTAKGVKGIHLKEQDSVIGVVKVEPEKAILTVTEKGFGKRTPANLYRLTHRAGIGVRNIICTEKNGSAVAIASVSDKDEIIIATKLGLAIRIKAKEIPLIGRATRGVKLIKLSEQDTVISITVIKEELENA